MKTLTAEEVTGCEGVSFFKDKRNKRRELETIQQIASHPLTNASSTIPVQQHVPRCCNRLRR